MATPQVSRTPTGGWSTEEQTAWYLERIGRLHPRQAGEDVLVEVLPPNPQRVLDLGAGDGRLTALVLEHRPSVEEVVLIDRSPPMLRRATERFADDARVRVQAADMGDCVEPLGDFDLTISGFAIHHLEDRRKRQLFREIARALTPRGTFANLDVVASASPQRHAEFLDAIGRTDDDPEDKLAAIEDQLAWMREAGLCDVDCLWRWRGFALMVGERS
jgi:tRNA (cmo5U34)-methyltransferase